MRAFGVVELQGPGDGVEHGGGDTAECAALQLGVVLHTDAGQGGDLTTTQARDTAGADVGHPGLLRGDLGPPRDQELAHLGSVVHLSTVRGNHRTRDPLSVHVSTETPSPPRNHVG